MKITDLIDAAFGIVQDVLIPLAFALCLLYFFWGVAKYLKSEGEGKGEGRKVMIWGVVALFIAVSIWGIIAFIQSELTIAPIEEVYKSKNL